MVATQEATGAQIKRFFEHPLGKALATVRSRRVGLGYSIEPGVEQKHPVTGARLYQEKGPLAFASNKRPVPLTEEEEAILCWAACGPNGVIAWDIALGGGFNELVHLAGRTTPAPGNSRGTDLLVINDKGTFIYKPSTDRNRPIEIEGPQDHHKILDWYRTSLIKIGDERPLLGYGTKIDPSHHDGSIFGPYQYNMNMPGSTWLIPIQDNGWLYLSVLPVILQWNGYYIVDDFTGEPAGMKQWVDEGKLHVPMTLSQYEQFLFQVETYVPGCMVQNVRLAAETLGLGTWVYCGYSDDALMGAVPELTKGIGFKHEEPNLRVPLGSGQVVTAGLEGIKEATYVPSRRYKDGMDCITKLFEEKYGPGATMAKDGNSWGQKVGAPYKPEVFEAILKHKHTDFPQWTLDASASFIDYCVEKWGQCPVFQNPMQCNFGAVIHHVDTDFYDQYYVDGYVTDAIRETNSRLGNGRDGSGG
jgi:hypothetical protein